MFRSAFLPRCLALAGWSFLLLSASAQDLSIDFESVTAAELRVRVTGPDGEPVVIEVSDNLIDWAEFDRGTLEGGTHAVTDSIEGVGDLRRFYRARILGADEVISLYEEGRVILAGDTVMLRLQATGSNWQWSVNGTVGGDATVGTIRTSPTDPLVAIYTAPPLGTDGPVTIRASDLDDASRFADTEVEVVDIPGDLVIVPGATTIGVGRSITFQAGIELVDIGFVPLRNAIWKINGLIGGEPELGRISLGGVYDAPPVLPPALPVTIEVGYSLGPDQAPLRTTEITLVDVEVTPGEVVRFDETEYDSEPPTQFVAKRLFSDGTVTTPAPSDFNWASDYEPTVTVDNTGLLTVWEEPGLAVVTATDNTYQVLGSATVKAREPVYFWDIKTRTLGNVSTDRLFSVLEVTQPNVTIALDPRLRITRVPFYQFNGPDPQNISGADIEAITYSATGDIADYNQFGAIVQNTGIAGRIEEKTGVLEIGDTPGQGVVTVTYDDGEWNNFMTLTVRYAQLDMAVTVAGSQTGGTDEVYISEWIDFDVHLTNPFEDDFENGASEFIGRMDVKVEVVGGDEFWIAYDRYLRDGELPPTNGTASRDVLLDKVTSFTGHVAEVPNPDPFVFGAIPHPNTGRARFSISPTRVGEMTFRVSVPNDPNIPAQTFTLNVVQPELEMFSIYSKPVPPDNQVAAGHWLPLRLKADQPGLRSMQFNGTSWADLFPEQWVIQKPDNTTIEVPVVEVPNLYDFKEYFDDPGTYRVRLGLAGRPELASTELVITTPDMGAFDPWPTLGDNPWGTHGVDIPASMLVGGVEVVSPRRAVWIPGEDIPVVLQFYDGAGNATSVGYTYRQEVQGGNSAGETVSTTRVYARPVRQTGPSVNIVYPTVATEGGGVDEFYVNAAGQQEFTLHVNEADYTATQEQYDLLVRFNLTQTSREYYEPFAGEQLFQTIYAYNSNTGTYNLIEEPPYNTYPPLTDGAKYQDPNWSGLYNFLLRISGHGVVFSPRRLPIPSQRVRDAVAAGDLPAEAAQLRVVVKGTEGFPQALAAGFTAPDLGSGLSIASHEIIDGDLHLVLDVDETFWATASSGDFGIREVELALGDGSVWPGEFELFGAELDPTNPNDEVDLALNARYGLDAPVGAVGFGFQQKGISIPTLTAELLPSVHASWDVNRDGVADPDEDTNADGLFTVADVGAGAAVFRGQLAASPIVGFSRQLDPRTGVAQVRRLSTQVTPGLFSELLVYGNTTDRRTLSDSLQLGEIGAPDALPDFVSSSAGAETLVLKSGDNFVDFLHFTAYNFASTFIPAEEEPVIGFDELKAELNETYRRYSQFDLPVNTADVAANPKVTQPVTVWVDHEATDSAHFREEPAPDDPDPSPFANYLYGQLPTQYYGGMLDQYFQAERTGPAELTALGHDGRVRAFTPFDPPGTPTGTTRYPFGVALDGVLYDAFYGAAPEPRVRDVFYAAVTSPVSTAVFYGGSVVASSRFDYDPNSAEILSLGVVADLTAETGAITAQHLLPRLGGTSGGFVDLRSDRAPTFTVESSLPGAQLPGLHAGYLIKGRPDQILDPTVETIEDDMEDVSLVRLGNLGAAAGTAPVREDVFLGTRQPRPVMTYGSDSDKKAPVETAVRVSAHFGIGVDPADFTPAHLDTWKIKAGLNLTEKQDFSRRGVDLLVTTQSDGDEEATKIIADAVVDLSVDIIANAVLSTMTSGGYLAACGGGVSLKQVATAGLNLAVGLGENEILDVAPGKKGPVAMALTGTLNGIDTPLKGFGGPNALDTGLAYLQKDESAETGLKRFTSTSNSISQPLIFNHCDLLQQPFNLLKDRIKSSYSARTFGGLGASEAVGIKVLALCIPIEAQLNNGVFSAYTSFSRRAFIQPKEQAVKPLSELPWDSIWDSYPYPDEVSDEELLTTLLEMADDPTVGEDAQRILRAAGASSLQREMNRAAIEGVAPDDPSFVALQAESTRYQSYKLRTFPMNEISLYVGPGHQVDANGENAFGDFVLTPHETMIPVSYGAVATASRTNENANARAVIRHQGIDLKLVGIVIQDPADLPEPTP